MADSKQQSDCGKEIGFTEEVGMIAKNAANAAIGAVVAVESDPAGAAVTIGAAAVGIGLGLAGQTVLAPVEGALAAGAFFGGMLPAATVAYVAPIEAYLTGEDVASYNAGVRACNKKEELPPR